MSDKVKPGREADRASSADEQHLRDLARQKAEAAGRATIGRDASERKTDDALDAERDRRNEGQPRSGPPNPQNQGQPNQGDQPAFANPGAALGAAGVPRADAPMQTGQTPGSATGMTTGPNRGPNMDPAAAPPSPNHPENPGAALQQPQRQTPQQAMVGMKQAADQSGGGEQGTVNMINTFCDLLSGHLQRGDVYAAQDLVQQFRNEAGDLARSLKPR